MCAIRVLGSFTGIRIGVATAKAFSDSKNIPLIGVSSLEALAYNASTQYVCSLLDCKNENCYIGLFKKEGEAYNQLLMPFSASIGDALFIISKHLKENSKITFVGDGVEIFNSQILKAFPDSIICENNTLNSYNLGIAGFYKFKNNDVENALPMYLRKPQAQRELEEKLNHKN